MEKKLFESQIMNLLMNLDVTFSLPSGEAQYGFLLARREMLIAKDSQERQFRSVIEMMNNEYLQRFVNQFRVKRNQAPEVQQEWAEHFYSRLDDLLLSVERSCGGDRLVILATYKKEIEILFEKEKIKWEALL